MIRFQCDHCQTMLRVGDEKAGKTAACPKCRAKVAIPSAAVVEDAQVVEHAAVQTYRDRQPTEMPSRPSRLRAPINDVEEPEADEVEERPRKRRRRRKRRRSGSGGAAIMGRFMDPFIIGSGTALVLWGFAMLLLLLHVPWSGFFALAIAGITALIGRIWFLSIAFSEDTTVGLLVLWVPFYEIYFLITNLELAWRPYALNVVGGFLLGVSFCGGAMQNMAEVDREAGVRQHATQFADLPIPPSAKRLNSAATVFAVSSTA